MKVLVLNGSPRKGGNTSRLIDLVLVSARAASRDGVEVEYVILNDLSFRGCQECLLCKSKDAAMCKHPDALASVIASMAECDAWVLGTPIFMGQISGQLKLCLDRTFGFSAPDRTSRLPPGKRVVLAVTQGNPNMLGFQHVTSWLASSLSRLGAAVETVVAARSTSVPEGHVFQPDVEDRARAVGAWMAGA